MEFRILNSGICIENFKASGVRDNSYGLALILSDEICESAGVFTRNKVKSGSLIVTKRRLKNGFQAIIANSGNANACTRSSLQDAIEVSRYLAKRTKIQEDNIAVASTGIIGKPLDLKKIKKLCSLALKSIGSSPRHSELAAKAIMTTDTKPKEFSLEYKGIKIGSIAKGAGMIAPNMATMLAFIVTNAALDRDELQESLNRAVDKSFNMLVIDNDLSTNDMVLLLSNSSFSCDISDFQKALEKVTIELAKLIAKDGEGSTKYIEVEVKGSETREAARRAARAVIASNLVKAAIYGENPNWGRIIAAAGKEVEIPDKFDLFFESKNKRCCIVKNGEEKDASLAREILKEKEIKIILDLKTGEFSATAFGCDLSPEYVKINAEYN